MRYIHDPHAARLDALIEGAMIQHRAAVSEWVDGGRVGPRPTLDPRDWHYEVIEETRAGLYVKATLDTAAAAVAEAIQ